MKDFLLCHFTWEQLTERERGREKLLSSPLTFQRHRICMDSNFHFKEQWGNGVRGEWNVMGRCIYITYLKGSTWPCLTLGKDNYFTWKGIYFEACQGTPCSFDWPSLFLFQHMSLSLKREPISISCSLSVCQLYVSLSLSLFLVSIYQVSCENVVGFTPWRVLLGVHLFFENQKAGCPPLSLSLSITVSQHKKLT